MGFEPRVFTLDELGYIVNGYGTIKIAEMQKVLKCGFRPIMRTLAEYGLIYEWTEVESTLLEYYADKHHYHKVAELMERDPEEIYQQAKILGIILIQDNRKWNDDDNMQLENLWDCSLTVEAIAQKLRRTTESVKKQAIKLNLGALLGNRQSLIISDICAILKVSRDIVYRKWIKLGLKIIKIKTTKDKHYFAVTLENLLTFLEEHQNLWDASKLEEYALIYEPEWLRSKRINDILEPRKLPHQWKPREVQRIRALRQRGYAREQIKKMTGFSLNGVAYACRQLKRFDYIK